MFQLLGAFAEFERNLIRERVKAGLANAKAKGVKLGRPSPKFDEDELIRLRKSGLTIRRIAERLNLRKSFVHKTLSNYNQISL
jgi:DNA invertase Pin-like site-specific DNA recombinase